MTQLGISIAASPREDVDRFLAVTRSAEAAGVDHVWVLDSQTIYQNAYVLLGLIARETDRIGLGPGVTNLLTRHETVVANAMSTIAVMAPGRLMVGIGTGDSSVRPLGLKPLRLAEFRDRVARFRALLNGETVQTNGSSFRVALTATPPPRIYVGATRRKMLELAGEIADGVVIVGAADQDFLRMQMAAVDRGAERAGRDPNQVERDIWVGFAVGDGDEPVRVLASYAATQSRMLMGWQDLPPSLAASVPEMERIIKAYDLKDHLRVDASHASAVSRDLVKRVAVAGTWSECRDRLSGILDLNPTRISMTLLPRGREKRLEEIASLWSEVRTADVHGRRSR